MVRATAYAKLDLAIHIDPQKMDDGYFPVHYVDCQIDIADKLSFEYMDYDIEVYGDDPEIPKGEDNFVYKAADLLRGEIGDGKLGVKIRLSKNIPIKAGFGGGSSDAAATLVGLCKLWEIKLTDSLAKNLAGDLGKDFYYSIYGGLSEVLGNGKDYKVVPVGGHLPQFWVLILVPFETKPSTSWVYEHLTSKNIGRNSSKIAKLKEAILKKDKKAILANLTNDFESDVSNHFPVVEEMEDDLRRAGALSCIMAGAGLSVVGFFDTKEKTEVAREKLKGKLKQILVAKTIN